MFAVAVTNNSPHPYRETLSWTLIAAGATETVSVADIDKLAANIAQWNSIMGYTAIEMSVVSYTSPDVAPINVSDGGVYTNTDVVVIAKQTGALTSADFELTRKSYSVSAIGLAENETVTIEALDRVNSVYGTLAILTATKQVANISDMPLSIRAVKTATTAQVGVVLSHY